MRAPSASASKQFCHYAHARSRDGLASNLAREKSVADTTTILGIAIPSTSPMFLVTVGFHVLTGLGAVISGAVAMLSKKGGSRHIGFGGTFFWCLTAVFVSASALAVVRWAEDYQFFLLGMLAYGSAVLGRCAIRQKWRGWPRLHVCAMGFSDILMLTAFYVDNGKNLPVWRELPSIVYSDAARNPGPADRDLGAASPSHRSASAKLGTKRKRVRLTASPQARWSMPGRVMLARSISPNSASRRQDAAMTICR